MTRRRKLSSGLYSSGVHGNYTDKEWEAITQVAAKLDCGWDHEEYWEGYISAAMDCTLYISPTGLKPYFPAMQEAGIEWGRMRRGNEELDFEDLFKSREVTNLEERVDDFPTGQSRRNGDWEKAQAAHYRAVADYLKRQAKRMEKEAKRYDRQLAKKPIMRPLSEAEKAEANARGEQIARELLFAEMTSIVGR